MSSSTRYVKEFHRLIKGIDKKTNGQALIHTYDITNLGQFTIEIVPKDGPYKNGKFLFQIMIPGSYPDDHPEVICLTDIYHPNVDIDELENHNICLNLFDEWNRSFGLEDCIQGLLFLLYHPNTSDPISGFFDGTIDQETFEKNVVLSLSGQSVDGFSFAKNPGWEELENSQNSQNSLVVSAADNMTNETGDADAENTLTAEALAVGDDDNDADVEGVEHEEEANKADLACSLPHVLDLDTWGFRQPPDTEFADPEIPIEDVVEEVVTTMLDTDFLESSAKLEVPPVPEDSDSEDELRAASANDSWFYRIRVDSPELYRRQSAGLTPPAPALSLGDEDSNDTYSTTHDWATTCSFSEDEFDEDEEDEDEEDVLAGIVVQGSGSERRRRRRLRPLQNYEEFDLSNLTTAVSDSGDLSEPCLDFVASRFIYSYAEESESSGRLDTDSEDDEEIVLEPADRLRIVRRGLSEIIMLMDEDLSMEIMRSNHGRLNNVVIRTEHATRIYSLRNSATLSQRFRNALIAANTMDYQMGLTGPPRLLDSSSGSSGSFGTALMTALLHLAMRLMDNSL